MGLRVTGLIVVPCLSLHPQENSATESEQKTSTFAPLQNASGSSPSTCVPTKVNASRVPTKFPNSVGIVPSKEIWLQS